MHSQSAFSTSALPVSREAQSAQDWQAAEKMREAAAERAAPDALSSEEIIAVAWAWALSGRMDCVARATAAERRASKTMVRVVCRVCGRVEVMLEIRKKPEKTRETRGSGIRDRSVRRAAKRSRKGSSEKKVPVMEVGKVRRIRRKMVTPRRQP